MNFTQRSRSTPGDRPPRGSRRAAGAAFLGACLVLGAPRASAVECDLAAVADTTLLSSAPANPQGRLTFLRLGSPGAGFTAAALLGFDAKGRCPGLAGASIDAVVLVVTRLECGTAGSVIPLVARNPRKAWVEATATWNTHGPESDPVLFSTQVDCAASAPAIADPGLTALVQAWADGSGAERGLDLSGAVADGKSMTVHSRESTASKPPRLRIQYTPALPACPDEDRDGYAACSAACLATGPPCGDCDDARNDVHPGQAEVCDGTDNDCNPATPERCAAPPCDFDGNGSADIVWRNTSSGEVGAWLMDGTHLAGWAWMPTEPSADWRIWGCGDFAGDGGTHVLWRNLARGDNGAWLMDGPNVVGWAPMPAEPPGSGWAIQGVGDFDRDGGPDVLWRNALTGATGAWRMQGPNVVGWIPMPSEPPASGWAIQGVGDFDRDADPDVLWRNAATGQVGAWLMDGSTVVGWAAMPTEPPQTGWEIRAVLDLTGDGGADVVWRNTGTGAIGAWIMDGARFSHWVPIAVESPTSGWEIVAPR